MTVLDATCRRAVPGELVRRTGRRWHGCCRWLPLVALVAAGRPAVLDDLTCRAASRGRSNSPGTLQLLALCLVFGGLATGYDLLFGRTGLLSFGHALYFAAGVYGTDILVNRAGLPLWLAALLAITGGHDRSPLLLGAVALRASGHRVRHGDAGLRPGRRDPGGPQPGRAHRRRGGAAAGRVRAARRAGRGGQHGQPVLAGAGVPDAGGLRGAPGERRRRPAGCWPGCATTSGGSGCSGWTRTASSWWRSSWPAALASARRGGLRPASSAAPRRTSRPPS